MSIKQLVEIKKISGDFEILTGMHIGSGSDEIKIGGVDSSVIKDQFERPYIPGSSIKGKIRSLLELTTGRITNGKPFSSANGSDPLSRIFGNGAKESDYDGGPTRAIFCDAYLKENNDLELEVKAEVSIDRITGAAAQSGPRHIERVPRGALFPFEIFYKIYSCDDDKDANLADQKNFEMLLLGVKLLELDCLGGSGSRGYGRVKVSDVKIESYFNTSGKPTTTFDFDKLDLSTGLSKFILK